MATYGGTFSQIKIGDNYYEIGLTADINLNLAEVYTDEVYFNGTYISDYFSPVDHNSPCTYLTDPDKKDSGLNRYNTYFYIRDDRNDGYLTIYNKTSLSDRNFLVPKGTTSLKGGYTLTINGNWMNADYDIVTIVYEDGTTVTRAGNNILGTYSNVVSFFFGPSSQVQSGNTHMNFYVTSLDFWTSNRETLARSWRPIYAIRGMNTISGTSNQIPGGACLCPIGGSNVINNLMPSYGDWRNFNAAVSTTGFYLTCDTTILIEGYDS